MKTVFAFFSIHKTANSAIKTLSSYIFPTAQENTNLPKIPSSSQKQPSL